jgi:hypothetical protein
MRRGLAYHIAFLCVLLTAVAQAQPYGDEWIVSNQTYKKIPVWETGIYAVPLTDIAATGLSTSDPTKLQMWFRGQEVAVHIESGQLYFYGQRNDATLDANLYEPIGINPQKHVNLFADTTYYFVTVGTSNGKRMQVRNYAPSFFTSNVIRKVLIAPAEDYSRGKMYFSETFLSEGDDGEGWMSEAIRQSGPNPALRNFTFPLISPITSSGTATLSMMLVGRNSNNHFVDILIGPNSASPQFTFTTPVFTGRINREISFTFPSSLLVGSSLSVFIRVRGDGFSPDFVSLASAELSYPAVANQNSATSSDYYFSSFGSGNLSISNIPSGSLYLDLSSLTEAKWMTANNASGTVEVSPTNGTTRLFVSNQIRTVSAIRNVNLAPYTLSGRDFLLVTHAKLMEASRTYASYRASISGGSHDTLIADVLRLYDRYTFGEKSPLALYRFFDQIIDNGFDGKVFLVGKGLHYDLWGDTDIGSNYYRFIQDAFVNNSNPTYRLEDLIPSAGHPASDNLYVADASKRPRVAISRLSARTNDDILQYLDKVQLTELQTDNAQWRKEFLHLSGGNTTSEVNLFRQYVANFEAKCESQWYAGNVRRTLTKNITTGAVDSRLIGSIADEVNNGLGYLTFYGHSSPDIVDVDIGFVSNPINGYSNYGKYPFMLMNGCSSAEFFGVKSVPEDWIMTPNKGAVMAMGHSDIGYTFQLYQYTLIYYHFAYNDTAFKSKSIAEIQNRVVDSVLTLTSNELYRTQASQFMLQGDPAMKMFRPEATDYQIAGEDEEGDFKVFIRTFDGNTLSAKTDSFQIGIPVQNLGAGNTRLLDIKVFRTNSAGTKEYAAQLFPATLFLDTVYFTIKDQSDAFFGQNVFEIYVDYLDSIPESNENNNKATLRVFIPSVGVKCLLPREFNIESTQNIRFVIQATDLTVRNQKYRVELDTSYSFNSAGLKVFSLTGDATVVFESALLTDLMPSDSLVYFWRARADNEPDDTVWEYSSFTYIKNSPAGWSQSRIEEVYENNFSGLQLNPLTGQFTFKPLTLRFEARVAGMSNPQRRALEYIKYNNIGLYYNGAPLSNCTENFGFHMLLVNGTNGNTYVPSPLKTCGSLYDYKPLISFYAPNLDAPSMLREGTGDKWNTIMSTMAPGNLMFLVSTGDTRAGAGWKPTPSIQNQLQNDFGSYSVYANNSNARPFIFLSRKGSSLPIIDTLGLTDDQVIEVDTTVQIPVNEGTMTSAFIGPGYEWNTIYRKVKKEASDSWNLSLIRFDGKLNVLDTLDLPDSDTIDISWLDAVEYPFIKLLYLAEDGGNNTPPNWLEWQVIHKQSPEGYLDPLAFGEGYYSIPNRPEGDTLRLSYVFKNLTAIDFASPLKAVITITGPSGKTFSDTVLLGSLEASGQIEFEYIFNTQSWPGVNRIQCFVNPYLQAELYYFNNAFETSFYVEGDLTHPILDVAFDGVHIFDGDIVSPQPIISISLKDNNASLPMPFTTVKVFMIYPGSNELREVISTDAMVISWSQDHSDASRFLVEFQPKNLPDGVYTLVVQGSDASGNKAGSEPYRIRFEVINKSSITNFYPYPNPFSTSCRFVFTLTGSEIPDNFKIQIMTVNGKIVREIFKEELGPIHAGNNITEFAWDGTDQFGDRLANGVYLYRIVMRDTDTQFEHRETAADKAFKQGYGKLYILR